MQWLHVRFNKTFHLWTTGLIILYDQLKIKRAACDGFPCPEGHRGSKIETGCTHVIHCTCDVHTPLFNSWRTIWEILSTDMSTLLRITWVKTDPHFSASLFASNLYANNVLCWGICGIQLWTCHFAALREPKQTSLSCTLYLKHRVFMLQPSTLCRHHVCWLFWYNSHSLPSPPSVSYRRLVTTPHVSSGHTRLALTTGTVCTCNIKPPTLVTDDAARCAFQSKKVWVGGKVSLGWRSLTISPPVWT